jgi:hypothetical protein
LSKVRGLFGAGLEHVLTGAAPVGRDVLDFFAVCGVPVLEGYGLTESCAAATLNTAGAARPGTVGRPLRGVSVAIAGDGEVLLRGPNVFTGYHRDEAATAEVLAGGWLRTGDLGSLDERGFLTITGRKKDIIITSSAAGVVRRCGHEVATPSHSGERLTVAPVLQLRRPRRAQTREVPTPWRGASPSVMVMTMISQPQNEGAATATASAEQLAAAAARLRRDLAGLDAIEALPLTLSRVGDAIDDLASGVLILGETVARSSGLDDPSPDLDHLPPEARALCWHLHELAARLRAARASVETAHDWSRDPALRRAGESELAGVPFG